MEEKLFGFNNPNRDIFIVEGEEGGTDDDVMSSMIGDQVMRHVDGLTPAQRQLWEEMVVMGNANIFQIVPSYEYHDRDPLELKRADIDKFFKKNNIPESAQVMYEEALEVEMERREASEDVYDRNEGMISFEEWQDNPGLGSHVDLPTTPKPISRYMGNCTQMFYDDFPEGHPDSDLINSVIQMLNKDVDDLTPKYAQFIRGVVMRTKHLKYTRQHLFNLIDDLTGEDPKPEQQIRACLRAIDTDWSKRYRATVLNAITADAVTQLFIMKQEEWEARFTDKEDVTQDIKAFGKTLFESFQKDMKNYHWQMYSRIKKKFAPKLMFKGIDINRCRYADLERVLGVSKSDAMRLWFERPWGSMYQLENEGIVLKQVDNTIVNKILGLINETVEKVKSTKNRTLLAQLANRLVDAQKSEKNNLSNIQWNTIWQHYRSVKSDLLGKADNE